MKYLKLDILPKQLKGGNYPIEFKELRDLNHNVIPSGKVVIRCEIQYQFREDTDTSYYFKLRNDVIGYGHNSRLGAIIVIPMRKNFFEGAKDYTKILDAKPIKLLKVEIKDGIRDHTW